MPRKKKDGRFINYYIDRSIYERLERYAQDKGQQMTTAIERILETHLDQYESELAEKGGLHMYCANCGILADGIICPNCGRPLHPPQDADYCFLCEMETIWTEALKDILSENEIPFVTKNTLGAGLAAKMGPALERTRFFVPYECLEAANALHLEFFGSTSK